MLSVGRALTESFKAQESAKPHHDRAFEEEGIRIPEK
jgi:hypothetical protein